MTHTLAINTYGAEQVGKPPVSAYKIGYLGAGRAVLLALFGPHGRDVTPKRARYHYMQLDGDIAVKDGYILLTVTDEELAQAEKLTRLTPYAGVYLWQGEQWWTLPDADHTERYLKPAWGPNFNPTGQRTTMPKEGKKAVAQGITAEYSRKDGQAAGWWWLSGDTFPHRDTLRNAGFRWSQKRHKWYFIGATLPDVVQPLLQSEPEPVKLEPIADEMAVGLPQYDDTFQAFIQGRHPSALMLLRQPVREGYSLREFVERSHEAGESARLGNERPPQNQTYWIGSRAVGYEAYEYAQFLRSERPKTAEVSAQRAEITPSSQVAEQPDLVERDVLALSAESESHAVQRVEPSPSIRHIEPEALSAQVLEKVGELARTVTFPSSQRWILPQAYCGEVTGSITGDVFCYGWAVRGETCIYLNMAGPRGAVEAIRAKLAKGEIVNLIQWDGPSIELTAGEGQSGMYTAFLNVIPSAKFASCILLHEQLTQPNYGGDSQTFIIELDRAQALGLLYHHINELVNIALFPMWVDFLWQAGQAAGLILPTRSGGGVTIHAVQLDNTAWTRLITGGLANGLIHLPDNT